MLDYCDAVWTPTSVLLTKRLERIRSRFLKGISACSSYVKLTLAEAREGMSEMKFNFKVLSDMLESVKKSKSSCQVVWRSRPARVATSAGQLRQTSCQGQVV